MADVLGLRDGVVVLAPYSIRWPALYAPEAQRIAQAIGEHLLDIEHIGSTSVPGLSAKPILDMMGGLSSFDVGLECIEPLATIGYEYLGADLVPGHHIFGLGGSGEAKTHHLHLIEHAGLSWREKIAFRDQLRSDPPLRQRYETLKVRLADQFADQRAEYTEAKGAFILSVLRDSNTPSRIGEDS